MKFLAVVFIFLASSVVGMSKILHLEASKAKGDHSIHSRTKASSGKTVLLKKKKSISLNFCLKNDLTSASIKGVLFSNDGDSERCFVFLNRRYIGSFSSIAKWGNGHLWNVFHSSGTIGKEEYLKKGLHYLKIECDDTDGIEIDVVKMAFSDSHLTQDTLSCRLQCQSVSALKRPTKLNRIYSNATASQHSYPTKCAEEDNVHVPLYMDHVANYTITATLPSYTSYNNRRKPDETNCYHLSPVYWKFSKFTISSGEKSLTTPRAKLLLVGSKFNVHNSNDLQIDFDLAGPSKGHIDSEIGSFLVLKIRPVPVYFLVSVTYKGRSSYTTSLERKYIFPGQQKMEWSFPDFTWVERTRNRVTVTFSSVFGVNLFVEELRMERRYMKPENTFQIYKSDEIIIDGIDIDFTWREPEKMKVRRLDTGNTWDDVDYFRILRPVPWADGFAQVFVLYQDGNARLQQLPPSGLDWIPFGSSVIIGQNNPKNFRPSAPIAKVEIDPQSLTMHLIYRDGGSSKLHLKSGIDKTTLTVTDIRFKHKSFLPFATFRSMYVEDGNSDCDRIMVDDDEVHNIMDPWRPKLGSSFSFFRECESKHLTLSPDIRVDVTGVYD